MKLFIVLLRNVKLPGDADIIRQTYIPRQQKGIFIVITCHNYAEQSGWLDVDSG